MKDFFAEDVVCILHALSVRSSLGSSTPSPLLHVGVSTLIGAQLTLVKMPNSRSPLCSAGL
jgi:hypothetical protein